MFGGGFHITISFLVTWVYLSFYLAVFFPVGFLRNHNSLCSISLDNLTVSFLTTLVYSSFYLAGFFPVGFKRNLNSVSSITLDKLFFLQKLRLEASSFINHMKIDFISNFNTLKRMPLHMTITIRLKNIHPNLINFIHD